MSKPCLLSVQNAQMGYPRRVLLDNWSAQFHRGERLVLTGPNGSGKSTFLKSLIQPELLLGGEVRWSLPLSQLALMSQTSRLDAGVPCQVREFLKASLSLSQPLWRPLKKESAQRIEEVLRHCGLAPQAEEFVHRLSGGETQRLFLARALLLDSEVLLLDEPFSAVDIESKEKLMSLLDEQRSRTLQILVLHDPFEVLAARAPILRLQDGRIELIQPEEYRKAQERRLDVVTFH